MVRGTFLCTNGVTGTSITGSAGLAGFTRSTTAFMNRESTGLTWDVLRVSTPGSWKPGNLTAKLSFNCKASAVIT